MTPAENAVEFRDISKVYGRRAVLNGLTAEIAAGTFTVIFGAPGSGKSVLLRLLTGLEKPDKGTILLRGQDVHRVSPADRNIGYVPQSFALYPHYSVRDNIGYPLKLMGQASADINPVVERTASLLKISELLQKKPDQLSGGEKQRVAIARGIVKHTDIFVLDDPLTGLDFKLREQLFDDLRQMREDLKATFIYTTSDSLEALMLAEDVRVFDAGTIIEAGKLVSVYQQPATARTMALLGYPEANLLSGSLSPSGGTSYCQTPIFKFRAMLNQSAAENEPVTVGIRPRDVLINPTKHNGLLTTQADITLVEDLGGELVVYLEVQGQSLRSVVRHDEVNGLTEGKATVGVNPASVHLFRSSDGLRIGWGSV